VRTIREQIEMKVLAAELALGVRSDREAAMGAIPRSTTAYSFFFVLVLGRGPGALSWREPEPIRRKVKNSVERRID
jgi:hypothetical protein